MELYEQRQGERDNFEIVAFHDPEAKSFRELDEKLRPIIRSNWKGKKLPFPILLDATGETLGTNYYIRGFPTMILFDPEGRLVRNGGEALLTAILDEAKARGPAVALGGHELARGHALGEEVSWTDARGAPHAVRLRTRGSAVNALAFSPDGQTLAAGGQDRIIYLFDARTGQEVASLKGHDGPVFALAFSPDGRLLASAGFDTVRLWDLKSRRQQKTLETFRFPAWSVAFSPDGRELAAGGVREVRRWDLGSGMEKAALVAKSDSVCKALRFSPDGGLIAAHDGGDVALWETASAKRRATLAGHASPVVEILFDPDGRTMASVTRGQTLKFWELSSGREDATAIPALRRRAARFASEMAPDAGALNAEAHPVVLQPGRPAAAVQKALEQAREANRLEPANRVFQETLGLALCRAGRPREAVPLLRTAAAVLPKRGLSWFSPLPASLPALVIALYQAGDPAGAVGAMVRLRAQMLNQRQGNEELVREAEELLFGPGAEAARRRFWASLGGLPGASPAQEAAGSIPPKLLVLLQAERIFRELQPLRLRAKVAEALAARRDVSDESRAMVLAMVREMEASAGGLNSAAWEIAQGPGRTQAEYELAVAQAEAAIQLEPSASHLNTLGVAFYRAGRWRDAIDTLSRSRRLNPAGINAPDDIAFLALAYHRVGEPKRAAALLGTLRQLARTSGEGNAAAGYLPEVESVLNPR